MNYIKMITYSVSELVKKMFQQKIDLSDFYRQIMLIYVTDRL